MIGLIGKENSETQRNIAECFAGIWVSFSTLRDHYDHEHIEEFKKFLNEFSSFLIVFEEGFDDVALEIIGIVIEHVHAAAYRKKMVAYSKSDDFFTDIRKAWVRDYLILNRVRLYQDFETVMKEIK